MSLRYNTILYINMAYSRYGNVAGRLMLKYFYNQNYNYKCDHHHEYVFIAIGEKIATKITI